MLLALDTSTPLVAVAVYDDAAAPDDAVRSSLTSDQPMRHGESVAPLVDRALAVAGIGRRDLTGIAVGTGPGPFTGLRVGLVSARVLGLALGLPVRGVCSLDAVAAAVPEPAGPFVVVTDARRKELFHAAYSEDGRRLTGPAVSRPDAVLADLPEDTLVVGPGVLVFPDAFASTGGPAVVDAGVLARVVATASAEVTEPEPIYLRRPDAVAPGPPKRVS